LTARRIIAAMTRRSLPAPKDLGASGVALWRRLTKEFDFNSAETELAHQLCVTVDEETMMRDELADMGVTVAGSKGQPVLNPVFAQLAVHRKLIDQLTTALSLPLDGEVVGRRRSAVAKQNADSRWRKAKTGARIRKLPGGGSSGTKAG
jgi:hypothetical protein